MGFPRGTAGSGVGRVVGVSVGVPGIDRTDPLVGGAIGSSEVATMVPEPVIVGGAVVLGTALWLVTLYFGFRLAFRCWRRIKPRVVWAVDLVVPRSPVIRFSIGAMVIIALIIGIVGALPTLVGTLAKSDEGAAGYVNQFGESTLDGDWSSVIEGDAVGGEPTCSGTDGTPADTMEDTDGDGLPDEWERAGETPGGAALPDADPDRKDLYVQVNYGQGVERLTDEERDQLRSVWARMPVWNPDGTAGIDLHIVAGPDDGRLGDVATVTRGSQQDAFYTADNLGPKRCVYRQVTYGRVDAGDVAGFASRPGYAAVVDGSRQPAYDGAVSFRVAVTTHELLHTTVGRVDGRDHTDQGWLSGGAADEYLAPATSADLNETGLYGPAT